MHLIEGSLTECESRTAEQIAHSLKEIAKNKKNVVFGICGGRSVAGIFTLLLSKDIPWSQIHIFMVDERCVSLNSVDSNYRLAYETFLKKLINEKKIPLDNIHPFVYDEKSTVACIRKYMQQLDQYGGAFDLILLSSGEDGHVASLHPKHRSITNFTKGFFIMADSPKPPPKRMTASKLLLQESKVAFLLFLGSAKEKAYERFNDPNVKLEECPAKLISSLPEVYIVHTKETK